jgi:hypothetical protein
MSTATKGHIYYIFKVNGADDVYKLGITNDIERRWKEHGFDKVTLVGEYNLGEGKAYKCEQALLKYHANKRLTKSGEYVKFTDDELCVFQNTLEVAEQINTGSNYNKLNYKTKSQVEKKVPTYVITLADKSFINGFSTLLKLTFAGFIGFLILVAYTTGGFEKNSLNNLPQQVQVN